MGQCNFAEFNSYFISQHTQSTSIEYHNIPFDNLTQKERDLWQHELAIGVPQDVPDSSFWNQQCHIEHPCFAQIAKDVRRTYPQSAFFGIRSNIDKFEYLLRKLALYFPKMGYTQGINFIAGYVMMSGFEDQDAFRIMVRLLLSQRLLAIGLYEDNFPLNKFYCEVFWQLLAKKLPRVHDKIQASKVPDQIWIFQWFISFFLYSFPLEIVKHFWEFIICKKQFALILLALGVIKCLKNQIIGLVNPQQYDFYEFFDRLKSIDYCNEKIDIKKVINYANSISKADIERAISSVKCTNNFYRNYFISTSYGQQRQLWSVLVNRLSAERIAFHNNPEPKNYSRDYNQIQHLQKLVLSKWKLYQSQFKKSSASFYKMSNFSIPFSTKTTNPKMDFNKRRF